MDNKLALSWLRTLAVSAEELQQEVQSQDGEPTQTQLAQYETIVESGGGTVDMLPLAQVAGPVAMAAELDKIIEIKETTEEPTEVTDEEVSQLTAAAVVNALECLEAEIEANPENAFNINRYDAIGKVFFNNPSVTDAESHTTATLVSAVESLKTSLCTEMSVSVESFEQLISDYGK